MGLRAFGVNIIGLSNKVHHFTYEFGDEFFAAYGTGLVSEGHFKADVELNKHETFIEATFKIAGHTKLICDRSLDPFDYPINFTRKIVFKYGDADEELSDEIVMIHRDTDTLDLGQYIYEFIGLQIPIKRLHPRYQHELDMDDDAEGKIIYTSGDTDSDPDSSDDIDPRWEKLKKLK
jgi:uncharacterized metal-binding protein YceD (DUF177 family)